MREAIMVIDTDTDNPDELELSDISRVKEDPITRNKH
jgi:hypothetical protein